MGNAEELSHDDSPPSPLPDHNGLDLEKQVTQAESIHNGNGASRLSMTASSRRRVTRTQSLALRGVNRGRFSHPLAHVKTTDAEIVDFDGDDDPYRPINWPFRKKVVTTFLYGLTTLGATWATSVYSPAVAPVSKEYGVGKEVSLLGTSFLLLGFGLGPLLWAPLSEV
jgi:hypothetical protein